MMELVINQAYSNGIAFEVRPNAIPDPNQDGGLIGATRDYINDSYIE